MTVEVDQDRVNTSLEKAYRKLAQRVNIPGFRRGKAPRHLVERAIGKEYLLEEALETLIPDVYNEVLEQEALDAVAQPRIQVTATDPVTFEATVPIRPSVTLGDYQAIREELEEQPVTDEDIDASITSLLERRAAWEPVERPVKADDLLTLTIEGTIGGEAFPRQENVQYYCILGSQVPVPGFPEVLEGTEVGVERTIEITVPEDSEHTSAGKFCTFTLTVTEIREKQLPALDDAFAQSLDEGLETEEELRIRLRRILARNNKAQALDALEGKVLQRLVDEATMEIPPALVEHEVAHMLQEQEEELKRNRLDLATWLEHRNQSEDEFREEITPVGERRIRQSYVISEFAKAEGVEVEDADIDADIEKRLQGGSDQPSEASEAIRAFFNQPDIRSQISRQLFVRKVLDRLTEIATEGAVDPGAIREAMEAEEREEAEARSSASAESVAEDEDSAAQ